MVKRNAAILLAVVLGLGVAGGASADRGHSGGHFGGGHFSGGHFAGHPGFHHFSGPRFAPRIIVGGAFYAPFYYPPMYYDPSYDPDYYPPANGYVQSYPAPAAPTSYWYYCAAARAYYPYVQQCPQGWQRVAPQPPA